MDAASTDPGPERAEAPGHEDGRGIACVMVNYGAADLILARLGETLAALRRVPGSVLFVVDNASPGDDVARLREGLGAHEDAVLVAHTRNGGFAAGNNAGFAALRAFEAERGARFGFVFLLNPDAWPEEDAAERLVAFARAHPRAGVVGPAIRSEDGAVHWSAFRFPSVLSEIENRIATGVVTRVLSRAVVSPPPPATPARTDWVSGAALLMPRGVIDALGPMDEGYFLYFEETDYQRAAARAGYEVWYAPDAGVTHLEGATTGQGKAAPDEAHVPDYWYRSRRRYFEKNHGAAYADRADRAWLLASRAYVARQKLLGRSDGGRAAAIARFRANQGQAGDGAPEGAGSAGN